MFKLFPNSRESKLNWARLCVNEHLEINHVCLCTINTCYYIFKSHSYIHIPMLSNNVPLLYVIMRIWWCHVFVPMEIHSRCCSQRRGSSVEGTCAGGGGGGVQRRDCRLGMFKHKGFGGEIYGNISGISWDIYIYQWVDDRMTSLWLFNITEHGWAWPIEIDDFWWLMYRSAKMLVFQFATLNYEKVTSKHSQQRGCTWICISLSNWRRWSVVFNPVMNAI